MRKIFPLLLIAVAFVLLNCNGDDYTDGVYTNDIQSVTVTPTDVTLQPGALQQLVAFIVYTDGTTQEATTIADWSSDDPNIATVNDVGVVAAGNTPGATRIRASVNGVEGFSLVTVAGTSGSLTVTPDNSYLQTGNTLQLGVAGATGAVTYSSSNPTAATVDTNTGLITGQAPGQTTITATSASGQTGSVDVNVFSINVFTASGSTPAGIQGTVDSFRAALGTLNPNTSQQFPTGRREINWDGVPAGQTNTDTFPSNFFNSNSPRGVIFTSANGTGFRVSDNLFADVNANYPSQFQTFSAPKLFAVRGSTTFDTQFFLAASSTPGYSAGFGAVFVDPDNDVSRIDFVLPDGSVVSRNAPAIPGAKGLSFLGVTFEGARISRATLVTGDGIISGTTNDVTNGGTTDIVVVDDFIYGEPQPTPIP